ncbi:MAG: DUF4249 family protein [Ignavibacteriae bacterium]|nr:DUF4249 family protein [Ignavibacteriota bacterium]
MNTRFRFSISRMLLPALLAVAALLPSCDNSFTPKSDYKERIVVFCVLEPSAPYQMVRLETTYDAATTNPDDALPKRRIDSAIVRINTDRRSYLFTDTLIDVGGGELRRVWISRAFVPAAGASYTMTVQVPGMSTISAAVQVPGRPYLDLDTPNPSAGRLGVTLRAGAISAQAPPKGFYFRLYVEGEAVVNGKTVKLRREVPLRVDNANNDTTWSSPIRSSSLSFSVDHIADVKTRLENVDGARNMQIIGFGYSLDTFIYSYFQTVRGFDDPVSVRQDRPDVTNIVGGVGIFGAIVRDTLSKPYVTVITN